MAGGGGTAASSNGVDGKGKGKGNARPPIYLDYNATTPVDKAVQEAMLPVLQLEFGNPSSAHVYGQKAKSIVDTARRSVASLVGCYPDEVVFTSGGTEANNWALKGVTHALKSRGKHIITSAVEHPAVTEVLQYLENEEGFEVTTVGVDDEGIVKVEDVIAAVRPDTILISIMLANNEVGSLQPVQEIGLALEGRAIALHTDASQAVGKIKVDWKKLTEVDLLTIAGHKLYGPKGVGALIVRRETPITKFMHGASHEKGMRGGTESTILIAGLGKACEVARKQLDETAQHMSAMRERLLQKLQENIAAARPAVKMRVNGPADPSKRLPNTLSVSFEGLDISRLMGAVIPAVACSTGSACHDADDAAVVSATLAAMKVPQTFAQCTLRLTTGRETTEEEVDRAAEVIAKAASQAKSMARWNMIF